MYVLDDIISFLLRLGEVSRRQLTNLLPKVLTTLKLAFAAVVAGLTGYYLNSVSDLSDWSQARFIYTEVVAALSILLALVWLFPFSGTFFFWPIDFLISIAWFVAFGLLVDVGCNYSAVILYSWVNASR